MAAAAGSAASGSAVRQTSDFSRRRAEFPRLFPQLMPQVPSAAGSEERHSPTVYGCRPLVGYPWNAFQHGDRRTTGSPTFLGSGLWDRSSVGCASGPSQPGSSNRS